MRCNSRRKCTFCFSVFVLFCVGSGFATGWAIVREFCQLSPKIHSFHIVTCRPIDRQRLSKHIPAQASARTNRTSTGRQRTSQHASLTIEAVFSAWSVQRGYKEVFGSGTVVEQKLRVEFRVISQPGYELGSRGIELSWVFGMGSCRKKPQWKGKVSLSGKHVVQEIYSKNKFKIFIINRKSLICKLKERHEFNRKILF
jgi:hypothetical protein